MSETNGPRPGGLNDIYNRKMAELGHITPPPKPVSTPLQSIARAIKALSYRDMCALVAAIDQACKAVAPPDLLAAADKLEAGE